MSAEVIPAGDTGSYEIPYDALFETGAVSLAAFEELVLAEARRRGLEVSVSENFASRGLTVRWRPDRFHRG